MVRCQIVYEACRTPDHILYVCLSLTFTTPEVTLDYLGIPRTWDVSKTSLTHANTPNHNNATQLHS